MERLISLAAALLLMGGASNPLPDDYAGQTAVVKDSHANYVEADGMKFEHVELYAMMELDGKIIRNAIGSTTGASVNAGQMRIIGGERRVPIKTMKVGLRAFVYYPSLFTKNFVHDTRRTVSFTPAAGETYVVRGRLAESDSDVWIETAGGKRITQ